MKNNCAFQSLLKKSFEKGFSLVELMIAILVGSLLMLAATGVLIANQRSFIVTEGMFNIQENARSSLDMLARDLREAGIQPCGTSTVINKVGSAGSALTSIWNNPVVRSELALPNNAIAGTSYIRIVRSIQNHDIVTFTPGSSSIVVSPEPPALSGPVFLCNTERGFVFTATSSGSTVTLTPQPNEPLTNGVLVSEVGNNLWFIGTNGRDDGVGRSLYREAADGTVVEMVDNVVNLQIDEVEPGVNQVALVVCGRRDLPVGETAENNQICPENRLERTVSMLVQTRRTPV